MTTTHALAPTSGQQPIPHLKTRGTDAGTSPPRHSFRRDIEGLRAVAVGLVLLDHVLGWPSGGFIGVDVFFVISGFLITGLLVRERSRTGRISFRAFYVRRARRLLPAAVATLGVTTLVSWALFTGGRFWTTVSDGVWALFFGANVNFARQGTDYFQQTAAPSPFQHFWSLAVEEQFYLFWPVLILAVFALPATGSAGRGRTLAGAVLAVSAGSFLWSLYATAASPATAYFSTFTRAWELGLGALIAVSAARLARLPGGFRAGLAWTGLAGIVVSAFTLTSSTPFPGSAAVVPVLSAGLLVAFGDAPGGPGTRWVLGSASARFLGRISYSLYLWHWPVVVLLGALLLPTSLTFQLVAVGLSVALATVSYLVVEQPVLHSNWLLPGQATRPTRPAAAHVFRRAGDTAMAALCITAVLSLGLSLAFPPGRLDPDVVAAANAALQASGADDGDAETGADPLTRQIEASTYALAWPEDLDPSLDELPGYLDEQWSDGCFDVTAREAPDCVFGAPDATQRAVVLGDSIAGAWLPGIVAGLQPAGWSVQTLAMGQCPNVTALTLYQDQPYTKCADHRQWALDYIDQTRPDLVVLSNAYNAGIVDAGADRATVFRDGLTTFVQRIQQTGSRVVVLARPPGSANLQSCATGLSSPTDCAETPGANYEEQVTNEQDVAAALGVTAIDPRRWFCANDVCPAVVGSTPVYADGLHMTAEYSTKIGPAVAAALLAD